MEPRRKGPAERYSRARAVTFAMPRLGTSILLGIENFAVFTLYVSGYGLGSFETSVALAAGYLSIAASQFLFGWISDHVSTRLGKRKPFIIALAPLLGVSFVFLLLPGLVLPDLDDKAALFYWMLGWDVVFRASYAVTTPYQAWMAEQFEAGDRPKVSQLQNVFNYIGNGLMAILSLVVFTQVTDKIEADASTIPPELLCIAVVFSALLVSLFYVAALALPVEPVREARSGPLQGLKGVVGNKNFLRVVLMQGVSGFGWSITTTVMLTYAEEVLQLSTLEYVVVAALLLLGILVFLQLWRKHMEKRGKKPALLKIFAIAAAFLPITLLGLVPMESKLLLGIVFILGVSMVLGGWFLLPYILYADIADDDDKRTGELQAGAYVGFPSIFLNICQAIGVLLLGTITSLPAIGGASYSLGYVLWGPVVSGILVVSWWYTRRYVTLDFAWESKV
ncbi:MAG: MFS transporter [Candidatus Lokiarchaeota archaeon]|nr:MFS transporter [Candidatus Lokiarchaeota archaeon]